MKYLVIGFTRLGGFTFQVFADALAAKRYQKMLVQKMSYDMSIIYKFLDKMEGRKDAET